MALIPDLNPNLSGRYDPATPSMGAAMAVGNAMQKAGNDVTRAAETVGDIGLKFQDAQDQGVKSNARLAMQQAFAEHQEFRMQNPDESAWEADMGERVGKAREKVFQERMSPFMKAELDATFQGWAQTSQNDVMLDKTRQTVARARQALTNEVRELQDAGLHDQAEQRLREAGKKLLLPEEEKSDIQANRKHAKNHQTKAAFDAEQARINANPIEVWKDYESPEPPEGADKELYAKHRDRARVARAQEQAGILNNISDAIAAKKIVKRDQLKEWEDELGADLIQKIGDDMEKSTNKALQDSWKSKPYQERMIGMVSTGLDNLDTDDVSRQYDLQSYLERIEEGPIKSSLSAQMKAKLTGKTDPPTALKLNLGILKETAKGGLFGAALIDKPQTVDDAIGDDFFQDGAKLQALGASPDQADEIMNPELSKDKRKAAFLRLYPKFSGNKTADEYTQRTAQAIIERKDIIPKTPEESQKAQAGRMNAIAAYGRVLDHMEKWAAAHPKDAEDDAKVKAEMARAVGPTRWQSAMDSGIDESGFDPAFGVLPTREEMAAPSTFTIDLPEP